MSAPRRINELSSVASLAATAAVHVMQGTGDLQTTASAFITEAPSYTPPGTGAVAEPVQNAIERIVHSAQYSSAANFQAARNALTGTIGLPNLSIPGTLSVEGALVVTGTIAGAISETAINAKGDLIAGSADNAATIITVGANETRLVADSTQNGGLKYVADTTNYAVGAKGDLLVGTAADTVAAKTVGAEGYSLVPSSGATDGLAWIRQAGFTLRGGNLDWTQSGNVLTVAIKTDDGGDPSDAEPVFIDFRDPTASTGSLVTRKIVAATSIAINDTALLGTVNGIAFRLWCVAFDDGGTVRLAVINCLSTVAGAGAGRDVTAIYPLAGWGIASATLEDNASDSAQVFYSSGAGVAAKPYATLGYATWEAGLATAGTWSAGPTRKQLFGPGVSLPGQPIQCQRTATGAMATGTTVIPADDTIPQITEGDQFMSLAITPVSAANALNVAAQALLTNSQAGTPTLAAALFQDATVNALAVALFNGASAGSPATVPLRHNVLASLSSATTFRLRCGSTGGTTTFNGSGGVRSFGGVVNSFLEVTELMA